MEAIPFSYKEHRIYFKWPKDPLYEFPLQALHDCVCTSCGQVEEVKVPSLSPTAPSALFMCLCEECVSVQKCSICVCVGCKRRNRCIAWSEALICPSCGWPQSHSRGEAYQVPALIFHKQIAVAPT